MAGGKPGKHTKKDTDKVRDQTTVKFVKAANAWCKTEWKGLAQTQTWSADKPVG